MLIQANQADIGGHQVVVIGTHADQLQSAQEVLFGFVKVVLFKLHPTKGNIQAAQGGKGPHEKTCPATDQHALEVPAVKPLHLPPVQGPDEVSPRSLRSL